MKQVTFIIVILTPFLLFADNITPFMLFHICCMKNVSYSSVYHPLYKSYLCVCLFLMFLVQEGMIIAKYLYVYGGDKWEER